MYCSIANDHFSLTQSQFLFYLLVCSSASLPICLLSVCLSVSVSTYLSRSDANTLSFFLSSFLCMSLSLSLIYFFLSSLSLFFLSVSLALSLSFTHTHTLSLFPSLSHTVIPFSPRNSTRHCSDWQISYWKSTKSLTLPWTNTDSRPWNRLKSLTMSREMSMLQWRGLK